MSSTQPRAVKPTQPRYFAQNGAIMTFDWTRPMPENGYLGTVSFPGVATNKPIQVFDPKTSVKGTDWAFQAQDGSFLCRMFVTASQSRVTFSQNRIGNWPNITVYAVPYKPGMENEEG
ncbi:MAG TPA: hypothetical protein VF666_18130 [Pyrinomonadaceae bacterium]|jgi:hypothetical protein